jgi:hypothetical protein
MTGMASNGAEMHLREYRVCARPFVALAAAQPKIAASYATGARAVRVTER